MKRATSLHLGLVVLWCAAGCGDRNARSRGADGGPDGAGPYPSDGAAGAGGSPGTLDSGRLDANVTGTGGDGGARDVPKATDAPNEDATKPQPDAPWLVDSARWDLAGALGAGGATGGGGGRSGTGGTSGGTGGVALDAPMKTGGSGGNPGTDAGASQGLTASPSFYLHTPPEVVAATAEQYTDSAMTCAADGFLAVYAQTIGSSPMVMAARFDRAGQLLDRRLLIRLDDVDAAIGDVQVAAGPTGYLVYVSYERTATGTPTRFHHFLILDAAAQVRAERTDLWPTNAPDGVAIAGGGTNYLVVASRSAMSEAQLIDSHLQLTGAKSSVAGPMLLLWGGGSYLVADYRGAALIADTSGDQQGSYQYWRYGDPTSGPVGFYANSTFYLFGVRHTPTWSYDTYGIRIRIGEGLLDPDDGFNQLSGGVLLCQDCGPGAHAAAALGGAGLVTVNPSTGGNTFRVDLTTFTRVGGGTGPDVNWGPHLPARLCTWDGTLVGLEAGNLDVFSAGGTPFAITLSKQAIAIPHIPDMAEPSVAQVGSRFMVAAKNMIPHLVLDQAGTLQPLPGLGASGQVAGNGTSYLYTRRTSAGLEARRVSVDGSAGELHALPNASTFPADNDVKLTSNNRYFLLTAATIPSIGYPIVYGIRLDAEGNFLDPGQELIGGTGYGVVADTVPSADYRTFGIFALRDRVEFVRLRSEKGVLLTSAPGWVSGNASPAYASDGSNFMAVYFPTGGPFAATLLDPGSGGVVDGYPVARSELHGTLYGAWFDGRSYLVGGATSDTRTGDPNAGFHVWRYGPDMQPQDGGPFALIPDKFAAGLRSAPALASDGSGTSLLAFRYADPTCGGVTIKGVFIHNDAPAIGGEPNTPDAGPSEPEPDAAPAICTPTDVVEWGGVTRAEGAIGSGGDCDPFVDGEFNGEAETDVYLRWQANRNGSYAHQLSLTAFGPVPSSLPAVYVIDGATTNGNALAIAWDFDSVGEVLGTCQATKGSLTITSHGPAGDIISGSFSVETWSGSNCASTPKTGTFAVQRSR